MNKERCQGCYNDFYNHGGATGTTKKCFGLDTAKIVTKYVAHNNQPPPFKRKEKLPSCYIKKGYALIDPSSLDREGFWRV